MIVTDITEYNTRKVLVRLDGHLIFPLYKGELRKYHIVCGEVLAPEICRELLEEVLPKRVKLRAMGLLQKRSYTRESLRRKLLENRYPEDMIDDALDYVASYHYLDDDRYVEEYIRCYGASRSKRRILQDLYKKGISQETAERVWQQFEEDNEPADETAQIMSLIRKKGFDAAQADRKEIARMMNYLYRKGYSPEDIRRCLYADEMFQEW
ncbi:MAG: regulatory protein RecX [Lachnospiraceae bacterium]|nr:regulatory protein RecX [Lachnospiraceae bacterium]